MPTIMKDEPTPRGHESSYPVDDRLVKELESLSKTTGSLDSFEVASDADIDEDPGPYYKTLRINSEASLSDIHQAFEKMNDAWHPDRYPHVISWEEKSKKKLKEIRNAYEKLLRLHPCREGASQGDVPSTPLLATTVVRSEYSDQERPLPRFTASPLSSSAADSSSFSPSSSSSSSAGDSYSSAARLSGNLLRRVIGIGLPTVVILILICLWPSLYHYEAINLGGKEYPLRINRITSHTTYYNGKQWIVPPVQVEVKQQEAAQAPPVQSVQSAQPAPPVQPLQPAQTVQPIQPVQPPLPSNSSGAEFTITGKPSSLPQPKVVARPAEREVPPPEVAEAKANIAKPYSIQITAYPEKDKAEALAKRLRGGKIPVRVEEAAIKGKGRWHRVLLGKFKNRDEALKYFNDHKIGKLYPQSFIQKPANY